VKKMQFRYFHDFSGRIEVKWRHPGGALTAGCRCGGQRHFQYRYHSTRGQPFLRDDHSALPGLFHVLVKDRSNNNRKSGKPKQIDGRLLVIERA
jgi:hypothetical protein